MSSKVRIFWEGQKDLAHFPIFFWHYILLSNYKWKMCQSFVAFSEYLNFKKLLLPTLDFRWSFPLFLSASIIKLSQSYSLHRFSKKILLSIDHTGHGGFFCTPGSWLKQIMRSWSILTFFSSQRGVSSSHKSPYI